MNTMKEELGNKDTLRLISQAAEAREACLKYLSLFEELANINGELKDPIFLKLNLSSPLQEMLKNASVIKKASQKVEDVYLEMQNEIRRIAYLRYKKEWLEKQPLMEIMDKVIEEYTKRTIEAGNISFSDWLFENGFENKILPGLSYDNFLCRKYPDRDYIRSLLSEDGYRIYLHDIASLEEDLPFA